MKKVHGLFDCVQEKRCRKCCVIKPLDQFYDQPRPNGGKTKTSRCIECLKPQMAAYRASHRNRLNQYHKDYYRSNRLENRKKNRDAKYGLAPGFYESRLAALQGRCEICGRTEVGDQLLEINGFKTLVVDHCHDTGEFRGLLCRRCNIAIGQLGNCPDIAARASAYLKDRASR